MIFSWGLERQGFPMRVKPYRDEGVGESVP